MRRKNQSSKISCYCPFNYLDVEAELGEEVLCGGLCQWAVGQEEGGGEGVLYVVKDLLHCVKSLVPVRGALRF